MMSFVDACLCVISARNANSVQGVSMKHVFFRVDGMFDSCYQHLTSIASPYDNGLSGRGVSQGK